MSASSVAGNAVLSRVKRISAVFHALLATASSELDEAIQPGKRRMCHSHSLEYVTNNNNCRKFSYYFPPAMLGVTMNGHTIHVT